jgi:Enoyl-CoA hydratase/carnithine racemase
MTLSAAGTTGSASGIQVTRGNDGIARITLDRPEKYNTLSVAVMAALKDEFDRIAVDRSVRVVVIAGQGKAFCAGHDLSELQSCPSREEAAALFARCSDLMLTITRLPQPVIARVHGTCTAAGTQLVAACDLAVAAEAARFAVSGVNLGLFCSTPMVALSRNLPRKAAMELLLTGEFIDAAAALRLGLVNRVVADTQLDAATEALALRIAGQSPAAVAFGKQLFYRQLEAGLEEAYRLATETMSRNLMAEDARAGIDAFIGKRPMPDWTGR